MNTDAAHAQPRSAWSRFWFRPTDPTTLGFMCIVAGCIVLYVHLVYSFDLSAFFGPDGWYNQEVANKERLESPTLVPPVSWRDAVMNLRVPDSPHYRWAWIMFLDNLPESPAARREKLRYLQFMLFDIKVSDPNDPKEKQKLPSSVIEFLIEVVRLDDGGRANMRTALGRRDVLAGTPSPPLTPPKYLLDLPADERVQKWDDILNLLAYLAKSADDMRYTLRWLLSLVPAERADVWNFIIGARKSPEGKDLGLPADPKARSEFLEYLDFWSNDPRVMHARGRPIFSPWFHVQSESTLVFLHCCVLAVIVLFTLGLLDAASRRC